MVVEKEKNIKAFKNNNLSVDVGYAFSKNAWMTSSVFKD